jgi:senataxin
MMLSACPKPTVWTFDTSPELPHTLFSEIKDNASFQDVVIAYYQDRAAAVPMDVDDSSSAATKGKGKDADAETPLSWVSDFLRSLVPRKEQTNKRERESALPQALAKAMSFCFAEMQHERLSENVKAASAKCGFDVSDYTSSQSR